MNRKLVSAIADLYFCPTATTGKTSGGRGSPRRPVRHGNTVIDALRTTVRPDYRFSTPEILNGLPYDKKKDLLVTCHRRENYGEPMRNIMLALRQIAEENRGRGAGVSRASLPGGAGGGGHVSCGARRGFHLIDRCPATRCTISWPGATWC
jgi:hypothetical protein